MTSYINLFLKTEVTCIPKLLKNYIGDYYNNALFNGATWVFVLWCVLHIIFDKLIDAFLKKLRYREYVRLRLRNSLWYLGFYGTAVIYSGAALAQNEVELFNFKKMHVPSNSNLPSQVVIGYTLISTFFLHSSLWEGLAKEYFLNMFSYLFLFLFLLASYTLRVVEISFTFTALVGIAQVAVEFTRCCFMSSTQDSILSKFFVGLVYFMTYAICFAVYIIVIPLTFIVPLGLKILSDYPNILLLFLFFNLVLWLLIEIYQSILFKFLDHWFYHQEEIEGDNFLQCSIGLLECSLFKPRDDISYNLQIIKREIKARQTKMMSLRKPKNKTMLIQTLKCMVAIKRKLTEKRRSDSSDSESERSDNINTDEDNGELLSDQDEETDDESQDSLDNKISEQNEQSDQNEESDNGEVESQNSEAETVKETAEGTDEKLKSEKNSGTSDNNNDEKSDLQLNKTIDNDDNTAKLAEAMINIKNFDDSLAIKHHDGDKSTVQTIKEETKSKDENSGTLIVEGDNNSKEIIISNKNEDNDNNNSVLSTNDNPLPVSEEDTKQNKEVVENLHPNTDAEIETNNKKGN
ncbi:uncharacterized protein LOC108917099 isoform X2 [Anoplophora glabripennis]|nr:uncharacterized protein LOC108917099 isoform X2 [Anoplophora glabripennis]